MWNKICRWAKGLADNCFSPRSLFKKSLFSLKLRLEVNARPECVKKFCFYVPQRGHNSQPCWGDELPASMLRHAFLWSCPRRLFLQLERVQLSWHSRSETVKMAKQDRSSCLFSKNLGHLEKKKEATLLLQLWTFLFFPSTSRSHFHLFPFLRLDSGQDESNRLNTSVRVRYVLRQLMWSKVPLKARIQRRTRDYQQFIMV